MQIAVHTISCPTCNAGEMHPSKEFKVLIRGMKVHTNGCWWSQCLVCAGYYDKDLEFDQNQGDPNAGWFSH